MRAIHVPPAVLAELRRAAADCAPAECCGILLGDADAISAAVPARNVHPTPATHFEIDPQALVEAYRGARAGGPQVAGYYHSHPSGSAEPSATDQAMAHGDGKVWAIIGRDAVTFWRDEPGRFAPIEQH